MTTGMMHEIVYVSAAKRLFNPLELSELLRIARRNNERAGVTGILLYHEGSFLQLLEGERSGVEAIYETVRADPRHWRVTILREGPVPERRFSSWSMGFVSLDPSLLQGLAGRHSLMSNGSLEVDAEDVHRLLDQFRTGQWRKYVNG
jgi:hypothetical protein